MKHTVAGDSNNIVPTTATLPFGQVVSSFINTVNVVKTNAP